MFLTKGFWRAAISALLLMPLAPAAVLPNGPAAAATVDTTHSTSVTDTPSGRLLVIEGRPSTVPADYVITPAGYVHPTCLNTLAPTEVSVHDPKGTADGAVDIAGNQAALAAQRATQVSGGDPAPTTANNPTSISDAITPAELAARRTVPACAYPRYTVDGTVVPTRTPLTSVKNGWQVSTQATQRTAVTYLHASWTVPAAPRVKAGQTAFFFPGVQNDSLSVILQPVLEWSGGEWKMASWACCRAETNGVVNRGPLLPVTTTTVSGDISGNRCTPAGVCATWTIQTVSGRAVSRLDATGLDAPMDHLIGTAMEAYQAQSCAELPAGGITRTSGLYLLDAGGRRINPTFTLDVVEPNDCGYSGFVASATAHSLYWNLR